SGREPNTRRHTPATSGPYRRTNSAKASPSLCRRNRRRASASVGAGLGGARWSRTGRRVLVRIGGTAVSQRRLPPLKCFAGRSAVQFSFVGQVFNLSGQDEFLSHGRRQSWRAAPVHCLYGV